MQIQDVNRWATDVKDLTDSGEKRYMYMHADRGRLLLRTPGPVPLGLAYVLRVETNPFPNLSLFYRTMLFEYPSVLSRFCLRNPSPIDVGSPTQYF